MYSHGIPQITGATDGLRKMASYTDDPEETEVFTDNPGETRDASEFAARSYQLELLECAKKQNCILVLGTGSGKTFISILLIKELAEQVRGSMFEGSKRTVFVVNTVPLVHQQAFAIENHTGLNVGKYEGSIGVDYWTDAREVMMMMQGNKENKEGMCYNPWTEHLLSDKSIADSVEALIGAYLLVGGSEAAKHFLHMLGIGVYNNESLLKSPLNIISPLLSNESWAKTEIRRLFKTACLDRLEDTINYSFNDQAFIVQAVTHSSYSLNKVTDCNQRLEFLGDAVLDYLVTGQIFSRHGSFSPGKISDLRSYYVKNETLARVAIDNKLHKHLLYLAPKLEASIDKFLKILKESYEEDTLNTEVDEVDLEDVDVPKALGDLVEAIIGAVYLDSGRSLEKTWHVIDVLIGVRVEKSLINIPVNFVRELYKSAPGKVKFHKVPRHKNDDVAKYNVQIMGLPILCGEGKNYRTARIAAAKLALETLQSLQPQ